MQVASDKTKDEVIREFPITWKLPKGISLKVEHTFIYTIVNMTTRKKEQV